jgi:hypothetical protein
MVAVASGLDDGRSCGTFRGKRLERGGEWCRCFSRRKKTSPFDTISLSGGPTEGTQWRTRLKVHSLHWILCSHNNTLHRSRRAVRLFDRQLTHCGPVNVNVGRAETEDLRDQFWNDNHAMRLAGILGSTSHSAVMLGGGDFNAARAFDSEYRGLGGKRRRTAPPRSESYAAVFHPLRAASC